MFYNSKKEKLTFTRYGGLSSVPQKHYDTTDEKGFHNPPRRRGIYAMPRGYEDLFLLGATDDPRHSGKRKWLRDEEGNLVPHEWLSVDWHPKTGKNIYTSYYNTKNLEIIYSKYTLTAPYNGVLTDALVTPGTLVRIGQKLGEFISPNEYEMELAVSKDLIHAVTIGKEVLVTNPENRQQTWKGKVSRINGRVNPSTQTVQIFVELIGSDLKEGMYLEADIEGKERLDAIKLSRNLLIDENKMYVVTKDSTLHLTNVEVVHKSRDHVIIQGVDNGDWILSRPIPGAYVGMKVLVKQED